MTTISATRRISIDVSGETVIFTFRLPSAAELSKFLSSRFRTVRNKVETRAYEARTEFFDKLAIDVEGAQYEAADGSLSPLGAATTLTEADKTKWQPIMGVPINSWKDLIPMSWKSSAIQFFEDGSNAEEAPGKN